MGDAYVAGGQGNIAFAESGPVVLLGAHDMLVVRTDDVTLVMPRSELVRLKQHLRDLPARIRARDRRRGCRTGSAVMSTRLLLYDDDIARGCSRLPRPAPSANSCSEPQHCAHAWRRGWARMRSPRHQRLAASFRGAGCTALQASRSRGNVWRPHLPVEQVRPGRANRPGLRGADGSSWRDGPGRRVAARRRTLPPMALAGRWPPWPRRPVKGTLLGSPWDLMTANARRIAADAHRFPEHGVPPGVHQLGNGASRFLPIRRSTRA